MNDQTIISDQHKLFIEEYLQNGFNATKAYMSVYPNAAYDSARTNAAKLLANTNIRTEIDLRCNELLKDKAELTIKTIEELKRLAFADIKEFLDYDNDNLTFKPSNEIDTRPIESVEITRLKAETDKITGLNTMTEKMKLKLYNKKDALETLCKYLGLFKEQIEISGNIPITINIQGVDSESSGK
jgi:phage terminase small subunit